MDWRYFDPQQDQDAAERLWHELGDLVNGTCRGRQNDKEVTFFKNNTGMGIQFAATARKMYEKAKEKGIGAELPLDLFMTKRGDKLYSP